MEQDDESGKGSLSESVARAGRAPELVDGPWMDWGNWRFVALTPFAAAKASDPRGTSER